MFHGGKKISVFLFYNNFWVEFDQGFATEKGYAFVLPSDCCLCTSVLANL